MSFTLVIFDAVGVTRALLRFTRVELTGDVDAVDDDAEEDEEDALEAGRAFTVRAIDKRRGCGVNDRGREYMNGVSLSSALAALIVAAPETKRLLLVLLLRTAAGVLWLTCDVVVRPFGRFWL